MAWGKPTEKQIKYFAERLKGAPTKKEAALKAGFSKETAENVSQKIEKSVGYQSLAEMLNTPRIKEKIQKVLEEGLDAKKVVVVDNQLEEVRDYTEQRQYARTIAEITGEMTKKIDVTSDGERITFGFQEITNGTQDDSAHNGSDKNSSK